MPVVYDNKHLIPVTSVNISREYTNRGDGTRSRAIFVVTVNMAIVAYKGSPKADGTFHTTSGYPDDTASVIENADERMAALRNKKGAILKLFDTQHKLFEIVPWNNSPPIKFVPRIRNINFDEGTNNWTTTIPCSIVMETEEITFGAITINASDYEDNDVEESWNIEEADDKGIDYRVTHSISASARDVYNIAGTGALEQKGWEKAKSRVENHLGFDSSLISLNNIGRVSLNTRTPYDYKRSEIINETEGTYSVTESWILPENAGYKDEYSVNIRGDVQSGLSIVSVEGTITGYESNDNATQGVTATRYANAETGFNTVSTVMLTRAQTHSGLTVNPIARANNIGKNPVSGVITYSYEYDTSPTNIIPDATFESITINDTFPADVVARHVIIGRAIGPVLQPIGTITESRRTVTIDAQMPTNAGVTLLTNKPDVSALLLSYFPTANYEGPYVENSTETWLPKTGRYTRSISWFWV